MVHVISSVSYSAHSSQVRYSILPKGSVEDLMNICVSNCINLDIRCNLGKRLSLAMLSQERKMVGRLIDYPAGVSLNI